MKLNHYLLFALSVLSLSLYSQNAKLSGKITDEVGEALISANVVIDASKGWAAVTDFDGLYEISLPEGTYNVSLRYIGKEEQKIKITLAADEKKTLNVVLREKQQLIDVVVVTGSKYAKKLGEETVSMDVIKGSSLTSQNITSLDGGMTRVPGVTIADGQVNIRGGAGWSYGAGSRVSVLVDDLPILTADANDAKWNIVPMENVDQVEVIKGAASALYGSGALNGVINVRTAYPTNEPYTKVTTYAGITGNPANKKFQWWGTNAPLFGGLNFAHRQKFGQHDLVIGGAFDNNTGYLDSSDSHAARGNIKYRYRVKKVPGLFVGVNVSAYYSWGKTFFFWKGYGTNTITGVNFDSLAYKPFSNTITVYKTYRFTIDPFLEYTDKKNNRFKFVGRFFNATNTNNTGQGSVPNRYYAELQYQRKVDLKRFDFNYVGGAVSIYDDVNPPKGATGSLFGKNSSLNFAVYSQVDFKFFNKLNFTVGARWEYFQMKHYEQDSTTGAQVLINNTNSLKQLTYPLFRAGLNYQAAEATYIRASFGQGFRYPTIAERYITTSVGPLTIASNPNLNPEKGYSAEVGIKQGFKIGKNWAGYADAAFFWNQYENMMEFTFGQFGPQAWWNDYNRLFGLGFSSQNIGTARIMGTEIMLAGQGKLGPVELNIVLGYNFIDPRAINWKDKLKLYNYEGYEIGNGIDSATKLPANIVASAYRNPDNNDTLTYITYSQTTSSSKNYLKYRSNHVFKFDLTLICKGVEWNTNLQFTSYQQNIDYAFISPLLTTFYPDAFGGLQRYRAEKERKAIGTGRGDIVWNMHLAYNFKQGVRVAFVVKNLLNSIYTPRPAYIENPRNFAVQLSYTFGGGAGKKAVVAD